MSDLRMDEWVSPLVLQSVVRDRDEARTECRRLVEVLSDRNATLSRVALEVDTLVTAIEDALNVAENINTPYDQNLSPWCDLIAALSSVSKEDEGNNNA